MEGIISIKQGDKELISSGTFLSFGTDEIEITLTYRDETIRLILEFITEESKEVKVNFNIIDSTTLRILFKNHNHNLGSFNIEPYELGSIGDRLFYFAYFITHIPGTERKKIDYSFYVGRGVQNG